MDRQGIEEKVRQVIMETLDLTDGDCIPETVLQTDALGLVQLAMQLEFKFGIEIDEDSFVKASKVQEIMDIVTSRLGGAP